MGLKRKNKSKIIVILGPTSSGKSDLAVKLSLQFDGEVVSADSRQVYKGMDIGSGKISYGEMRGVPHHLLDVASPKRKFTVAQYKKLSQKAINEILKKKKIPIVCGGTAFYITALVDGIVIPEVSPDWNLRKELEKKSTEDLYKELKKKDSSRAKNIDISNKRRLIRALEIIKKTKKPVPEIKTNPPYNPFYLGIKMNREELNEKIKKRLEKRLKMGMVEETKKIKNTGVSWKRIEEFGLEYRWTALYLEKKITHKEMKQGIITDTQKLAKKQMQWWKHDKRINWIKNYQEAKTLVKSFL